MNLFIERMSEESIFIVMIAFQTKNTLENTFETHLYCHFPCMQVLERRKKGRKYTAANAALR